MRSFLCEVLFMETNWRQTARFAFRQSLGVLFGYVFLGTAFGILLR